MPRYFGSVRIGQASLATATIDDIDSSLWRASLRDTAPAALAAGLVTIYLLDGDRAGAFAIGNLEPRDGYAIVAGTTRFGLGRNESTPATDLRH